LDITGARPNLIESDYPFGIFKLFSNVCRKLHKESKEKTIKYTLEIKILKVGGYAPF